MALKTAVNVVRHLRKSWELACFPSTPCSQHRRELCYPRAWESPVLVRLLVPDSLGSGSLLPAAWTEFPQLLNWANTSLGTNILTLRCWNNPIRNSPSFSQGWIEFRVARCSFNSMTLIMVWSRVQSASWKLDLANSFSAGFISVIVGFIKRFIPLGW